MNRVKVAWYIARMWALLQYRRASLKVKWRIPRYSQAYVTSLRGKAQDDRVTINSLLLTVQDYAARLEISKAQVLSLEGRMNIHLVNNMDLLKALDLARVREDALCNAYQLRSFFQGQEFARDSLLTDAPEVNTYTTYDGFKMSYPVEVPTVDVVKNHWVTKTGWSRNNDGKSVTILETKDNKALVYCAETNRRYWVSPENFARQYTYQGTAEGLLTLSNVDFLNWKA